MTKETRSTTDGEYISAYSGYLLILQNYADQILRRAEKKIRTDESVIPLIPTITLARLNFAKGMIGPLHLIEIPVLVEYESAKAYSVSHARKVAQDMIGVNFALTIMESWNFPTSLTSDERDAYLAEYGRIANCPNRVDTLTVFMETTSQSYWAKNRLIKLTKNGRRRECVPQMKDWTRIRRPPDSAFAGILDGDDGMIDD